MQILVTCALVTAPRGHASDALLSNARTLLASPAFPPAAERWAPSSTDNDFPVYVDFRPLLSARLVIHICPDDVLGFMEPRCEFYRLIVAVFFGDASLRLAFRCPVQKRANFTKSAEKYLAENVAKNNETITVTASLYG